MGVNTSICHRMRVGRLFPCGPVKVERLRDLALRIGYRGPVIDGEQTFSVTEVRAHDDGVVERLEHRADGDKWVTR